MLWIALSGLFCLGPGCDIAPQAGGSTLPGGAHWSHGQQTQRGLATWYGRGFHGRRTASGERYDMHRLTAAHRTLPFGTRVRVTNLKNRRQVTVRISDRGPFGKGRIIDLSRAAAAQLHMLRSGVAPVTLEVLSWGRNCRTFHGRTTCRGRRRPVHRRARPAPVARQAKARARSRAHRRAKARARTRRAHRRAKARARARRRAHRQAKARARARKRRRRRVHRRWLHTRGPLLQR